MIDMTYHNSRLNSALKTRTASAVFSNYGMFCGPVEHQHNFAHLLIKDLGIPPHSFQASCLMNETGRKYMYFIKMTFLKLLVSALDTTLKQNWQIGLS